MSFVSFKLFWAVCTTFATVTHAVMKPSSHCLFNAQGGAVDTSIAFAPEPQRLRADKLTCPRVQRIIFPDASNALGVGVKELNVEADGDKVKRIEHIKDLENQLQINCDHTPELSEIYALNKQMWIHSDYQTLIQGDICNDLKTPLKNEKGKEKAPYSTQIKADILNDYKYNLRYAQIDINSLKGQIVLPPTKEEIAKYGKKTFNKETTMALLAYLYDSSVPRIVTAAAVADKLDEYVSTKRDEANVWREELHSLELNHVNDNGVSGPRHGIQSLMEKIAHADKIAEAISFYQTALKTNTASNIQDKYYPAIKKDLVEIFHMSGHEVDQLIENHYTLGKVVDASGNVIDTINIHPHSVVNNHEQVGEETEKRIKLDMKKEQEEQQRRKRAEKKGKGSDDQFKAPAPGVQGGQNRAGTPSRGAVAAQ